MENKISLECPECKQTFTLSAELQNLYISIDIECPECKRSNYGQHFRLIVKEKPAIKPCKTGLTVLENFIDEDGTPGTTGVFYEITKNNTTVGRKSASSTADIQISSNRYMSRRHILLKHSNDRYFLEWIADTNPPVINGKEMSKERSIEIFNGDVIKLGQCTLRMSIAPSAEKSMILS